jgi:type IV secretion system protein TrbL
VQEKAQAQTAQAPGLEDRLRDLQQVRPPQLPSDAAAPATVFIKFDAQHD